jgi:hypothetical protein
MLVRHSTMLGMFVNGMHSCHGQRPDRDRSSHEEKHFVHDDSQPDAQPKQQRYACPINASVISSDCPHNISFRSKDDRVRETPLCVNCLFLPKSCAAR